MKRRDQGMTLLEVIIAITIFLIGVGFIVQSDAVSHRYRASQELRQQMIFYAAGQLDAALEKKEGLSESDPPFNTFSTQINKTPSDPEMQQGHYSINALPIQEIDVTVSSLTHPDIAPVTLKTYRVWTNP